MGGLEAVSLSFASEAGVRYLLQSSEDLVNFETLQSVIALGPLTQLIDLVPDTAGPSRFYRVVEIR